MRLVCLVSPLIVVEKSVVHWKWQPTSSPYYLLGFDQFGLPDWCLLQHPWVDTKS